MKKFILFLFTALYANLLLAQEGETKKVNIDINAGGANDSWYASPWVWVVGAAVFILLLVALTRSGRRVE
ncbi:MAG TPA: hypothetical protein VMR70_03605 [Flavisolibacter sp.]|nr:hypothetical protein [Flavisolibacter sp.]